MLERSMLCTLTSYENWRCSLSSGMFAYNIMCTQLLFEAFATVFHRDSNSVIADVIAKRARFLKVSP